MPISLANGGWCQWDDQLGSYNGRASEASQLVNGGYLWPQAWARAAGVTLGPVQIANLLTERDAMPDDFARWPRTGHPCALTKTQFLDRLTNAELAALLAAAKNNANIDALMYRLGQTTTPDLRHNALSNGLAALESAGLLAAGRADQILGK